jgi:hypothetical protein
MEQTFKLFLVNNKPYLTIDEDVKIGDKVIVTMGELYPTLVDCIHDDQINLFQKPKTTMTKRHKVVMLPDKINLDETTLDTLNKNEGPLVVTYKDNQIKIISDM